MTYLPIKDYERTNLDEELFWYYPNSVGTAPNKSFNQLPDDLKNLLAKMLSKFDTSVSNDGNTQKTAFGYLHMATSGVAMGLQGDDVGTILSKLGLTNALKSNVITYTLNPVQSLPSATNPNQYLQGQLGLIAGRVINSALGVVAPDTYTYNFSDMITAQDISTYKKYADWFFKYSENRFSFAYDLSGKQTEFISELFGIGSVGKHGHGGYWSADSAGNGRGMPYMNAWLLWALETWIVAADGMQTVPQLPEEFIVWSFENVNALGFFWEMMLEPSERTYAGMQPGSQGWSLTNNPLWSVEEAANAIMGMFDGTAYGSKESIKTSTTVVRKRIELLNKSDGDFFDTLSGLMGAKDNLKQWGLFDSFGSFLAYTIYNEEKANLYSAWKWFAAFFQGTGDFSFARWDRDLFSTTRAYYDPTQDADLLHHKVVTNLFTWTELTAFFGVSREAEEVAKQLYAARWEEIGLSDQKLPWVGNSTVGNWDMTAGGRTETFLRRVYETYTSGLVTMTEFNLDEVKKTGDGPWKAANLGSQYTAQVQKHIGFFEYAMQLIPWTKSDRANNEEDLEEWVRKGYATFVINFVLGRQNQILYSAAADRKAPELEDLWLRGLNQYWPYCWYIISQSAENKMRIAFAQEAAERVGKKIDQDEIEDFKDDLADAEKKALGDPSSFQKSLSEKDATAAELNKRQKFFKQCFLLLRAQTFKNAFLSRKTEEYTDKKGEYPFNARLYMIENSEDQSLLLNKLVTSKAAGTFFEIPPQLMSAMVPKLRFYKVWNPGVDKISEIEFTFPTTTDLERRKDYSQPTPLNSKFLSSRFDKGDGVGLKEFSFSFNGTNPAEARNDIEARLTLFFQSFADFVRYRKSNLKDAAGKIIKYRFVDLIIHPDVDDEGSKSNRVAVIHPDQYDPSFYRIRVEVGYQVPPNINSIVTPGFDKKALLEAIEQTNQSYYLNMIDHDLNVNPDGTVTVNIDYRAYAESALKANRCDALADIDLLQTRAELRKGLYNMLNKQCNSRSIATYKRRINTMESIKRLNSLNSIMCRLSDRNALFHTRIHKNDAAHFRKRGHFSKRPRVVDIDTGNIIQEDPALNLTAASTSTGTVDYILSQKVPANFNYNDKDDVMVQFFFFADLLDVICDSLYDFARPGKFAPGMENIKFILGSFDFSPYTDSDNDNIQTLNIGEIPISVDYFMSWMTENVLTQGKDRTAYPIIYFVRNLCNNLLEKSLLESCMNRDVKRKFNFQTCAINTWNTNAYAPIGDDPLKEKIGYYKPPKKPANARVKFKTNELESWGIIPFKGHVRYSSAVKDDAKLNRWHNYIVVSSVGSNLTKSGRGIYKKDLDSGRFWVNVGLNKGIVKTVSFAKSGIPFLREARFARNGIDGLLQLSNSYTATVEMYGNTLFYPGMELYINPWGIGGKYLGNPSHGASANRDASLANKLGLGGYHTITNVQTTITPGSFRTSVQAEWYFSGDAQPKANAEGKAMKSKLPNPDRHVGEPDPTFCAETISVVESGIVGGTFSFEEIETNQNSVSSNTPDAGVGGSSGNQVNVNSQDLGTTIGTQGAGSGGQGTPVQLGGLTPTPPANDGEETETDKSVKQEIKSNPIAGENITPVEEFEEALHQEIDDSFAVISSEQCQEHEQALIDHIDTYLQKNPQLKLDKVNWESLRLSLYEQEDKKIQETNPLLSDDPSITPEQRALMILQQDESWSDALGQDIPNKDVYMIQFQDDLTQKYNALAADIQAKENDLSSYRVVRADGDRSKFVSDNPRYKYDALRDYGYRNPKQVQYEALEATKKAPDDKPVMADERKRGIKTGNRIQKTSRDGLPMWYLSVESYYNTYNSLKELTDWGNRVKDYSEKTGTTVSYGVNSAAMRSAELTLYEDQYSRRQKRDAMNVAIIPEDCLDPDMESETMNKDWSEWIWMVEKVEPDDIPTEPEMCRDRPLIYWKNFKDSSIAQQYVDFAGGSDMFGRPPSEFGDCISPQQWQPAWDTVYSYIKNINEKYPLQAIVDIDSLWWSALKHDASMNTDDPSIKPRLSSLHIEEIATARQRAIDADVMGSQGLLNIDGQKIFFDKPCGTLQADEWALVCTVREKGGRYTLAQRGEQFQDTSAINSIEQTMINKGIHTVSIESMPDGSESWVLEDAVDNIWPNYIPFNNIKSAEDFPDITSLRTQTE